MRITYYLSIGRAGTLHSLTALFRFMRFTRQILAALVLAFYLAQVIGGYSLHRSQCSVINDSCHGVAHCASDLSPSGRYRSSDTCCHDDLQPVEVAQQSDVDSPGNDEQDDSSTCWICQVLGQAQDKPVEVVTASSLATAPVMVATSIDFFPDVSPYGFRSRAPPALLA